MLISGTSLGRYQIREQLGAGGMGVVYLAFDPQLGRQVAIKVLPAESTGDTERLSRFVREAQAASALNHPNILTVYDFGSHDEIRFLVTEYVHGQTLRAWIAAERPPLSQLLDVMAQTAMALEVAHEAGIVHRDIKPENVMLRGDGLVKVLDFGLAKLIAPVSDDFQTGDPMDTAQTLDGTVLGTVRYMSPEQANSEKLDGRTDVWSLGVVLYELLAGRPPFTGESPMRTLMAILNREPVPLEVAAPGTPERLCQLVARTLCKQPDKRAGSAELAAELRLLRDLVEHGPVSSTTATDHWTVVTERFHATEPHRPSNLPPRTAPLTGRERELEQLASQLREPDVRLVTITGAGGSGKTRLAVETGWTVLPAFDDGVFAVELAALRSPAHVAAQIAEALGVNEAPGVALSESLEAFLADKRMLLLLDNFEHLLGAAPLVDSLMRASPGLTVLATSQTLLRVPDEREFALEPLELPFYSSLPAVDEIRRFGAVALFEERARAVRPSFELTAENAHDVCEICRRLDGLPLAIELAAARVRFLSPQALLERLDHRLKLLTGGAPTLPDRQRTMRAAVAWSYDLLEEESERAVVRRLAVFAGGCNLEAAEAVCAFGAIEVLDAITSLVDKSLLRHREVDGQARFTMLQVVREFGLEQLEAGGETDMVRLAHAHHFSALARNAAHSLRTTAPEAMLKTITLEYENVRLGLGHLFEKAPEDGVQFTAALTAFWHICGYFSECREWVGRALAVRELEPEIRIRLLHSAGDLANSLGDDENAVAYASECVELSSSVGNKRMQALGLNILGTVSLNRADATQARANFEEGLALAREIEYGRMEGLFLINIGCALALAGDYAAARVSCEQGLDIEGRETRTDPAMFSRLALGDLCYRMGDLDTAHSYILESLSIASDFGHRFAVALGLDGLAAVVLEMHEPELAARLGGAAESIAESVGGRPDILSQRLHDDYVAKLGQALEADVLEREWKAGRSWSLEAAVGEALERR